VYSLAEGKRPKPGEGKKKKILKRLMGEGKVSRIGVRCIHAGGFQESVVGKKKGKMRSTLVFPTLPPSFFYKYFFGCIFNRRLYMT
jgi:hypothetical protein